MLSYFQYEVHYFVALGRKFNELNDVDSQVLGLIGVKPSEV